MWYTFNMSKSKEVTKYIAGLAADDRVVVVGATFVETPKTFMLKREPTKEYRGANSLLHRTLFSKESAGQMNQLRDSAVAALELFLDRTEKRRRDAEVCMDHCKKLFIETAIMIEDIKNAAN